MFENIHSKIKMLAKVLCWAGIASSVIAGFLLLTNEYLAIWGVITIVVGSLLSWVGSFALYGFGELIEFQHIQTELALKNDAEKSE